MAPSDDVIKSRGTYLQMTSPEIYSRRFSEFVRHFHSDEFTETAQLRRRLHYTTTLKGEMAKLNKRREPRPVGFEPTKRARKRIGRYGSEPTLFPPIFLPRNDMSQSSPVLSIGPTIRSEDSAAQGRKDETPSPVLKRETQKSRNTNSLSVDKSQEMVRLSPIATSDRKARNEPKQEKHSLTPRGSIPKISPRVNLVESHQKNERSNSLTDSHKLEKVHGDSHHRIRGKGKNSKSKAADEPFSVRRKIEQYRRWHEEQYLQKLHRFKQDSSEAAKETDSSKYKKDTKNVKDEIDLSKLLEEKARSSSLAKLTSKQSDDDVAKPSVTTDTTSARDNKFLRQRQKTTMTWKTWRNVNESDAYSDVKKYIEDNELMDSEKQSWIRAWICEVDRALCTNDCNSESDSV